MIIAQHSVHEGAKRFTCEFCGDNVRQYPAESKEFAGKKICCECATNEALTLSSIRGS
jgi:hypothetical protein